MLGLKNTQIAFSAPINGVLISLANEPSLGLYYVQQHIKATTPLNAETQETVENAHDTMKNALPDLENTIEEVKLISELMDKWRPGMFASMQKIHETLDKKLKTV
ncbi:unnamed protein product [Blepharisma stoltei]|uniref:Uncharacterized protein n=1 Tax=Blepharisma stoltei TaxID=1481888 RepID=A0AAU9JRW0_9CILI|nr:unnamed protein product [Blepharisma stoltei]